MSQKGKRVLVVLASLGIGIIAAAGYHRLTTGSECGHGALSAEPGFRGLGLSEEQKGNILALDAAHSAQLKKMRKAIARERIALSRLLGGDEWDRAVIDARNRAITGLEREQRKFLIDHLGKIRGILTPEQREKFFDSICCGLCRECRNECQDGECVCGECRI